MFSSPPGFSPGASDVQPVRYHSGIRDLVGGMKPPGIPTDNVVVAGIDFCAAAVNVSRVFTVSWVSSSVDSPFTGARPCKSGTRSAISPAFCLRCVSSLEGRAGVGGADKIEFMLLLLVEMTGGVAGCSTSLGGRAGGGEGSSSINEPCVLLGGIGGANASSADGADGLEDDVRDESLSSLESIFVGK